METTKVQRYKRIISGTLCCMLLLVLVAGLETFMLLFKEPSTNKTVSNASATQQLWKPPPATSIPGGEKGNSIVYGQSLIRETAHFLGPKGSVLQISNGMNCQNCHLQAGTKPFGNNYSLVATSYPKFRARSNGVETLYKRISDCFERSLNGKAPDSTSKEMVAIKDYIEWVGSQVPPKEKPLGSGITSLPFLTRAADPAKGSKVYKQQCKSCHGSNGEGVKDDDGIAFIYPPLWGGESYNDAAGLYRLSKFAGYVKYNMPYGTDFNAPVLKDEEAWDLAAFVNSQPRPHKDQSADWKDIKQKPIDFPFGPYADNLTEEQHKFGPFKKNHQ
ncbi:cytochrome C [Chitinophaga silvatica]|uniref:Cytochrome C n=1 Tax=Chitinophaga silvatica TaxID=2282649 RepID=A0A3E1YB84_9BACT|nr:c-type cytochrome [Chitinophaga silvatica]RFS23249.1 cytochrome C [Chitinophaga silvatica]